MNKPLNVVLMIIDGHGFFTGNMDWGTKEFLNLKDRMDGLRLEDDGYVHFSNVMSPAASTIMSIEAILSGIHSAKTHKMHWREWPSWDQFENPVLTTFLKDRGYEVNGFSYLLNSENWLPSIYCYRPDLYKDYPSIKRDTHSHEAVLQGVRHYFANAYRADGRPRVFVVHSVFLFDIWREIMELFSTNGFTAENTVFAATADHYFPYRFGRQWLLGERDGTSIFHHTDLTEHNTRVFFYLKYPSSAAKTIDRAVSGCDVTPTILDALGCLSEWPARLDGVSLMPLIRGEKVEDRYLRSDNVYPYQVGEKQGRIAAIKKGNYKYVYRPDGDSSYIAYRMTEEWSLIHEREEFYDVAADPFETRNLIRSDSADIQLEIAAHREFQRKSQDEIIAHHVETLRPVFRSRGHKAGLLGGKTQGRMLCVESCPDIAFRTLVQLLSAEAPEWTIDLVLRKPVFDFIPQMKNLRGRFIYPDSRTYEPGALLQIIPREPYDCILNTSGVPMGDYASVYDASLFPIGDLRISSEVIAQLQAASKATLCLDMTTAPIGVRAPRSFKSIVRSFMVSSLKGFAPTMKRVWSTFVKTGSRMPADLSERVIRRENREGR